MLMQTHTHTSPPGVIAMVDDGSVAYSRRQIRAISEAITTFRDLSPTMPVGEVLMFLTVALNEGSDMGTLADAADLKKSTASRYLLDLSDKTRSGGPGYGLIIRETDPQELRRNMYSLSAKGRKIVQKLAATNDNVHRL